MQGTHEGLAAARARGERIGRPPAMTEEPVRHALALLAQPENTITSIAKLLGVSRTTPYKYKPQLAAGRDSLVTGDAPAALPAPSRPLGPSTREPRHLVPGLPCVPFRLQPVRRSGSCL